jgi:anaerobic magnesium-protoporphyrin IX monomethyl ester cyclase
VSALRPIRRLLLIYPPERALRGYFRANVPPLGAAYLAAAVRDRCEAAVLDAKAEGYEQVRADGAFEVYGLSLDEIEARIRSFAPDAVGITCLASFNWPEVMALAARAKRVDPEIVTMAGGTHPSFLSEQCLSEAPALDLIVRGEGEATLTELIARSREGRGLDGLAGVAYRDGQAIVVNEFPPPIADLDSLPMPARDLLPMERYFAARAPFSRLYRHQRNTSIQTSRGCPAHCVFCSSARYWGHGYRAQSPGRVLAEMEHLKSEYGVRELQFVDDNLIFDRKRAVAIFKGMIERRLDLAWCMPNGVALWRLDRELLQLMRLAGCYSLTLAFESGNQQVLSRIVKKPLNLAKALPLVAEMKRLDLQIHAFFISGFPGETLAQMDQTYRLARDLDLDGAYFFIATPLPGTELCEQGQAAGHLPPQLDYTKIEYNQGLFNTPEWSARQVERATGRFYLKFMLHAFRRRPVRFLRNYGRVILSRPWYTLRHLLAMARRWLTEAVAGEGER